MNSIYKNGAFQHSDGIEVPKWFLVFLLEQIGGSLALTNYEVLSIQERNHDKELIWENVNDSIHIDIREYQQGGF